MNIIDLDEYPAVVEAVHEMTTESLNYPQKVSLRWLRNCTMEAIEPYLRYYLYRERIGCDLTFGGYDTIQQELVTPPYTSSNATHVATVLSIFGEPGFFRDAEIAKSPESVVNYLSAVFSEAEARCPHLVIVNTWIPPLHVSKSPGGGDLEDCVRAANSFIREFVKRRPGQFALADWERIAAAAGESGTFDRRFLYSAKAPFRHQFLRMLAFEVVRSLRVVCGRAKKCLVLDCDNTIWGGILGEDGATALQLDPYEYPGNVYYRLQETALALQQQGVLLCLCSKNDEQELFDFMENNQQCLLKKRHLAAWRVNWRNKAENIREIATELNLGLDSFVFVDDSPQECALVQEALPGVTVRQVPQRIYELPSLLLREGWFDSLAMTNEDRERTLVYQAESRRREERAVSVDMDHYLSQLELRAEIREASADELPRVAQLTQKTNQFNLTTIRYSQAEIEDTVRTPDAAVFRLRPADRFGDYGICGVLIVRRENTVAFIDTLLMSCRILQRRLEFAFVAEVLRLLEARWQLAQWRTEYRPTEKNRIVSTFWESLGFAVADKKDMDGRKRFTVRSGEWRVPENIDFIKIT